MEACQASQEHTGRLAEIRSRHAYGAQGLAAIALPRVHVQPEVQVFVQSLSLLVPCRGTTVLRYYVVLGLLVQWHCTGAKPGRAHTHATLLANGNGTRNGLCDTGGED